METIARDIQLEQDRKESHAQLFDQWQKKKVPGNNCARQSAQHCLQRHSQLELNNRSDAVSSSQVDERQSQLVRFSSDTVSWRLSGGATKSAPPGPPWCPPNGKSEIV